MTSNWSSNIVLGNHNSIPDIPSQGHYISNFITEEQEKFLLKKIYNSPKLKWKQLKDRRLQMWGGLVHPKGFIKEELPDWLKSSIKSVCLTGAFGSIHPNHVLVNEYQPGQGIMPHLDGQLYYPIIATVSLGGHCVLDFYKDNTSSSGGPQRSYVFSLFLEPRSLLVLREDLYHQYLHGIEDTKTDCLSFKKIKNLSLISQTSPVSVSSDFVPREQTRVSLTIRNVPSTKIKV